MDPTKGPAADSPSSTPPADGASVQAPEHWETWFWAVLLLAFAVRVVLASGLDLTPDEAYYWEYSRRLDLSYFDHPPMVGYVIALFRSFLGDSPLAVRLPALIAILVISRLMFLIGKEVDGEARTGFFAALIPHVTVAGVALGFITTPDVPLAFFWCLGTWCFIRILRGGNPAWWLGLGASLGFGAMSKYNMIFFCPAVALVVLGFPGRRGSIASGWFWGMFLLAALGAVPVLVWNANHDWMSFRFQFTHGLRGAERGFIANFGEFAGGQIGTIGPVLYPLFWWVMLESLYRGWKKGDEVVFFLAALGFPMTVFFAYKGVVAKVEANWPQVAYLALMPLAARWIGGRGTFFRPAVALGPSFLAAVLVVAHAYFQFLPLPPRSDVSIRLHGWTEMGRMIREFDSKTGGEKRFISQGAPLTALVAFYGKLSPERIGEIHGAGNWALWAEENPIGTGTDVIYVDEGRHSEVDSFAANFTGKAGSMSEVIRVGSREIRRVTLTHLRSARGLIPLRQPDFVLERMGILKGKDD